MSDKTGVAIVGFTDHRDQALAIPENFERWGINELYRYMDVGKFHRWFEIHKRDEIDKDEKHLEALKKFPLPIYMQEEYPDIPSSRKFPKLEVEQDIPDLDLGAYKTSSIAWMLGLALKERFKEIHVYGVDMAQQTEYQEQRPACEFLLGVAAGRGIKIHVPATSDLLKAIGQYGYGIEGSLFTAKLDERKTWLNKERDNYLKGIKQLESQRDQMMAQYNEKRGQAEIQLRHIEGAIQDVEYWKRSWSVPSNGDGAFTPDRSKDPKTGIKEEVKSGG